MWQRKVLFWWRNVWRQLSKWWVFRRRDPSDGRRQNHSRMLEGWYAWGTGRNRMDGRIEICRQLCERKQTGKWNIYLCGRKAVDGRVVERHAKWFWLLHDARWWNNQGNMVSRRQNWWEERDDCKSALIIIFDRSIFQSLSPFFTF